MHDDRPATRSGKDRYGCCEGDIVLNEIEIDSKGLVIYTVSRADMLKRSEARDDKSGKY